jgi:SnoaL-like domain
LSKTMAQLSDYEAIRSVVSAYCHIVDRAAAKGERPDLSGVFHPDAVLSCSFENWKKHVGHDAIVEWYHQYLGKRASFHRFTRHKIFEPYIIINGDAAEVATHVDADSVDFTGILKVIAGRYDDAFAKRDGRWLIKERRGHVHYVFDGAQTQPFKGWR